MAPLPTVNVPPVWIKPLLLSRPETSRLVLLVLPCPTKLPAAPTVRLFAAVTLMPLDFASTSPFRVKSKPVIVKAPLDTRAL